MLAIVEAHPLQDFKLALTFNNGKSGTVDLAKIRRTGVFEAWNDPSFFEKYLFIRNSERSRGRAR
jgi:hypothetical protein